MKAEVVTHGISNFKRLIEGICRFPVQVDITEEVWPTVSAIPQSADYGLLNGARGRQTNALRIIGTAVGCDYRLVDAHRGERMPPEPFKFNPAFDEIECAREVRWFAEALLKCDCTVHGERQTSDKLKVYVRAHSAPDDPAPNIQVLADVFYPYFWRKGMIVEIRLPKPTR